MTKLGTLLFAVAALPFLYGFSFAPHRDAGLRDEARITIRSESLVGLKLVVNDRMVLISQEDLIGNVAGLETAAIDLPRGETLVEVYNSNQPLLRIRFVLKPGHKKHIRLRR